MTDLEREQWNVDFDVACSIRYHAYRRAFWDAISNWSKVLTIVSGTGVLISFFASHKEWEVRLSFAVAIMSAADVVLGFSDKARDHDGLYRAFSRLAQDIAAKHQPTQADISEWKRRRLEIEMDEPAPIDWLARRCAAEECAARGRPIRPEWALPWFKVALSQWAMWPSVPRGIYPPRT